MLAFVVVGADDDLDCPHMWRLGQVEFRDDGSWTEYGCELCAGVLAVPPGGAHPREA